MSIWLGCYITLQCSAEDSLLSRGITLYFLPCSSTTNMSEQPDPVICPARKYGLWSGCNIPNAVTDETHNDDPAMFLQGFIYFLKGKKNTLIAGRCTKTSVNNCGIGDCFHRFPHALIKNLQEMKHGLSA